MSYAVVWSENQGPEQAGSLQLDQRAVRLSGPGAGEGDTTCTLRLGDLTDVYLERSAPARHSWSPSLELVDRAGRHVSIGSLQGAGALHELTDEVSEARATATRAR
jgi:hypothetical protein